MANIQSAASGNWNTGGTWAGGSVPTAVDTAEILDTHVVTVAADLTNNPLTTTIRSGGQLTVACQMAASQFSNMVVDSGGKIYASRAVSSLLRVAGTLTTNSLNGVDYGVAGDQISNVTVGAFIEFVCTSDKQANRGLVLGADNSIAFYGAALMSQTTLAADAAINDTSVVLTDDMALRPGALADVTNGIADMIVIGQPPTIGVGAGNSDYAIDAYLVANYVVGTKTVTLGDAGPGGNAYWPRGGVTPGWNAIHQLARPAGTPVWRLSCNVGIRGSAYNLRPASLVTGVYTATWTNAAWWWGGRNGTAAASHVFVGSCVVASQDYGFYPTVTVAISGSLIVCGCYYGGYQASWLVSGTLIMTGNLVAMGVTLSLVTLPGSTLLITGCGSAIEPGWGELDGTVHIKGNSSGISGTNPVASLILSGTVTFSGNNYACYGGAHQMIGTVTFVDNGQGLYRGTHIMGAGVSFSGNSRDMNMAVGCIANGVQFGSATEFLNYNSGQENQAWVTTESHNHDGVPGAFRAWMLGGICQTDATMPIGGKTSYAHLCESADYPCFRQERVHVEPHTWLYVEGWLRQNAAIGANRPQLQIVDPYDDPIAGGTALASIQMSDSVDTWEHVACSWFNAGTVARWVLVRAMAQHATATAWDWFKVNSPHTVL